jgi:tetratricopeptide (TPR) repeat protein
MYAETKNLIEKAMTNQEQIDKYLAGQMTEDEKLQFERLLSADDSSLRDEMELQKEIILAIRRRSLKEMLQGEEESIQKEKEEHHKRVVRWTLRSVASIAVAACLVGVIVIGPQMSRLSGVGDSPLYAETAIEMTEAYSQLKGCEESAEVILQANEYMQKGDYKQADAILTKALSDMKDITPENRQAWSEKEDILYLQALCAIKQHQLYRSRRLLNGVVSMQGIHQQSALDLLNTIKHGK